MLKNPKVCEYVLAFFVSIYSQAANEGERQIYPYAEGAKDSNPAVCFVNKQILNLNPLDVPSSISK